MLTRKELFNALGFVESSNNQKAVSPKGAIGTFQTMRKTLGDPGFGVKPARNNSLDEADRVGKDYLMAMLKRHDGNLERALVSYNYGPGAADEWIASGAKKKDLPKETRNYLIKMKKALGGANMARRPLEFIKQDKLSALTKKAIKNPDGADARKVVRELIARGLPVPNKLKGSIGTARARAGVGSPAGEVPRPKRKPAAPKAKAPAPKAKAPAPKANRQNTSLQRRLQQLMEDSLPLDEDVAGRALDQGAYAKYPEAQRAALNNALRQSGQKRLESRLRQTQDKTPMAPPGKNPTEGQFSYTNPGTIPTEAQFATPPRPGKNPTETDLMYMIGQNRSFNVPKGDTVRPPIESGGSFLDNNPGRNPTKSEFSYTNPGTIPTEDQFRAMRDTPRGSDTPPSRRGLPSLELMSNAPQADGFIGDEPGAPYRSSEGRGKMAGNKGYETLREYFIEDMTPRSSQVMTPFGIINIDSTQEGMFPEEDMYNEKKGGRLKKKKKPATRKKVAPKKKKVAVKKKPVVRKKAVAKKSPMRKKVVAKKSAGRKRAAKRGFGAELRGN